VRFSESSDSEKSAEAVAGHDECGLILEGSILAYRPDLPFKKLQCRLGDAGPGHTWNNACGDCTTTDYGATSKHNYP